MKKLEQLALEQIKKNASTINMSLYEAKSNLIDIKNTLMHCDPNMSKEAVGELIKAAQKALAGVETACSSATHITSWAEGLSE
jgi:hypothetical protein